ncbi:MAG: XRE family transcriptional regulator [Mesorhizobium sp.]|nr:MAG: XRE family transcriptional regulator [Mesorhizobium sp.]
MSYKSEELIEELKRARIEAALSQRDLSAAAGLTQSHISQIERGMLEPGLSSFIDLARALDLELVVVPKKLLPAIRAVIQGAQRTHTAVPSQFQSAAVRKFERLIKKQKALYGSSAELDQIENSLHLLRYVRMSTEDVATIATQYDVLKRFQASPQSRDVVREVALQVRSIRNRLAHARDSDEPRPAYSFAAGDDDA